MQLRIRVECAFGMFVKRRGIIQTAMPHNISIQRILATVNALSTLHHFCINEYLHLRSSTIAEALAADHNNIITSMDEYIEIELDDDNQDVVILTSNC